MSNEPKYEELEAIASDPEGMKARGERRRLHPAGHFVENLTEERVRGLTGDVDMMIVSGDNRISIAPQLPEHPIYTVETSRDRCEIVKKYQAYYNTLFAYETCQNKPFVVPVSACVDTWTRAQIVKFEMCKQPEELVEED